MCPIKIFGEKLIERGYLKEEQINQMWNQAEQEVSKSYDYAIKSKNPDIITAFENVYMEKSL